MKPERPQIFDADDAAEAWIQSLDRSEKIGSRHHTVPAFYLKRWALSDGKVRVYSRADAKFSIRNIRDLGIKDFYTFINVDGAADSRFEMLLSRIEEDAAAVLDALLSSFQPMSSPRNRASRWPLSLGSRWHEGPVDDARRNSWWSTG